MKKSIIGSLIATSFAQNLSDECKSNDWVKLENQQHILKFLIDSFTQGWARDETGQSCDFLSQSRLSRKTTMCVSPAKICLD